MFAALKHITLTLPTPAENLACDEALLDACESQGAERGGVLRFWESPEYFVVVGYGNKVSTEVNQTACAKFHVPILRRCSGGGTVVQGPGCLNYSLILPIDEAGPLRSITTANQFIMQQNCAAVQSAIGSAAKTVEIKGFTDLAVGEVKFSGNAQRRKKHFLLFHGTFLSHFDLALIERLLTLPSKEPDYRHKRSHGDFVANLEVKGEKVISALKTTWNATKALEAIPQDDIARLVQTKYATPAWNLKF